MKKSAMIFTVLICLALLHTTAVPGGAEPPDLTLKFVIPEHDLYPENIACAPMGDYFLGSMSTNRIIRIKPDGSYADFVSKPRCGLLSSVGMKVDAARGLLWVCSGRFKLYADYENAPARTGVIAFSLADGKPLGEWLMDQESDYHIFNDLVITDGGAVYATTTLKGAVYRIETGDNHMTRVHQLDEGRHNNGITLGPGEKYLFLTVDRSICRLEPDSGELLEISDPANDALGTDGLYFHEGSLICIKPRFNRITRLYLDEALTAVARSEVLVGNRPDFAYPTTGVISSNKLVFVGTSYADVPRNAESTEQHGDVLIFEIPLD